NARADASYERMDYSWVRVGIYERTSEDSAHDVANQIEITKDDLKRAYEAIRQEIGTVLLHLQLLDRYRLRCQGYNLGSVRRLVEKRAGGYERGREDALTRDLALYLFDQGVTCRYRVRFGQHEFDLLQADVENPIFIEAKAYVDSKGKRDLLS